MTADRDAAMRARAEYVASHTGMSRTHVYEAALIALREQDAEASARTTATGELVRRLAADQRRRKQAALGLGEG